MPWEAALPSDGNAGVQWAGVGVEGELPQSQILSFILLAFKSGQMTVWPCYACPLVPGHFLRASPALFNHLFDCASRPGVRVQVQGEGTARGNRTGHGPYSHFPKPRGPLRCASLQTGLSSRASVVGSPDLI